MINLVCKTILGALLIVLGVYGSHLMINSSNRILYKLKKQSAINQLDPLSLGVLQSINGLIFPGVDFDVMTMRHLIDLGMIKAEVFPSNPTSFGYYLSEEGRVYLTRVLKKELYPEIFCDLIRVRYWEGYPTEFIREKEKFREKYRISWEKCWEIFGYQLRKEEPQAKDDPLTFFNYYLAKNNFDTVTEKIVKPWQEELTKKR